MNICPRQEGFDRGKPCIPIVSWGSWKAWKENTLEAIGHPLFKNCLSLLGISGVKHLE